MEETYTDPCKEYLREEEPNNRNKGYIWSTAIGLQAVDGLKVSQYLIDTAKANIEGEITLEEARYRIEDYYKSKTAYAYDTERTEEADKVSLGIAEVLSETAFTFTPKEYISIHRKLFQDVYDHAGKIRDYNITKKEWVLDGATVLYGTASELKATLEYDFSQEKKFVYRGLPVNEIIHHLAVFISGLWQIHIFCEGNTRTTAVFFIKYLRTLGFNVTNKTFANNAWYFRNALVRANYTDVTNNIHETTEYLELFLKNYLLDENNELHNRSMHISGLWEDKKPDIHDEKPDIESTKPDIQDEKTDIEEILRKNTERISQKTKRHITKLFIVLGDGCIFGRSEVIEITGLKASASSDLIKKLKKLEMIESVSGSGKGKYKFNMKCYSKK